MDVTENGIHTVYPFQIAISMGNRIRIAYHWIIINVCALHVLYIDYFLIIVGT